MEETLPSSRQVQFEFTEGADNDQIYTFKPFVEISSQVVPTSAGLTDDA